MSALSHAVSFRQIPLSIRARDLVHLTIDLDDANSVINELVGKMNEQRIRHPNHSTASLEAYVRLPLLNAISSFVQNVSGDTCTLGERHQESDGREEVVEPAQRHSTSCELQYAFLMFNGKSTKEYTGHPI